MMVTWEEAVANSGRFGYRLDDDGNRIGYPLQFGEPFIWRHLSGERECMRWCNGVSEGFVVLERTDIEWVVE